MSPARRSGAALIVAAVLAVATAMAGCSVSTNSEPVAAGDLFDDLVQVSTTTTSTTTPEDVTKPATIYFLKTESGATRLWPVERSVDIDAEIQEVLNNLFTVPLSPDDRPEEAGLTSAIGDTAELISATKTPDSTQLVVNVSGLFDSAQGTGLRNALAQIVWTATVPSDITEVVFQNNGKPVPAIVDNGKNVDGPVDRSDYAALS